jgi:hypothetical protein
MLKVYDPDLLPAAMLGAGLLLALLLVAPLALMAATLGDSSGRRPWFQSE